MKRACLSVVFFVLLGSMGIGYGLCGCGGDQPSQPNMTKWIHHFSQYYLSRQFTSQYTRPLLERNLRFRSSLMFGGEQRDGTLSFTHTTFYPPESFVEREESVFWLRSSRDDSKKKPLRHFLLQDINVLHQFLLVLENQFDKDLLSFLFFPSIFQEDHGRRYWGIKSISLCFNRDRANNCIDIKLLEPADVIGFFPLIRTDTQEKMFASCSINNYLIGREGAVEAPIAAESSAGSEPSIPLLSDPPDMGLHKAMVEEWTETAASKLCCCCGCGKVERVAQIMRVFRGLCNMTAKCSSNSSVGGKLQSYVFTDSNTVYLAVMLNLDTVLFVGGMLIHLDDAGNTTCYFIRPMCHGGT